MLALELESKLPHFEVVRIAKTPDEWEVSYSQFAHASSVQFILSYIQLYFTIVYGSLTQNK